jgi:hypothetical protein
VLADASGDDVLKKTGIIVAAVATGLISLSSVALADDWDHLRGPEKVSISEDNDTKTVTDNSVEREQFNRCAFIQDQDSSTAIDGGALDGAVPPLPALPGLGDQAQDANCTNVGDTAGAALPVA